MDTLVKHNFTRPFQPNSRLTKADAAVVVELIGGLTEPSADGVAQLDRILASAYGAAPAVAGAFEAAVKEHGGLAVARAIEASFSLSGRPYQDIVQAAAAIAAEAAEQGTWHTGPPLFPEDDLEPEASQTAEVIVTDDPVVAEPAMVEDEPLGQVAPPTGGSRAAGPVSDNQVEIESKITDQNAEPWLFAEMPWLSITDEQGKAQKIPARSEWQLTLPGQWQVPDWIRDESIPDDDIENDPTGLKIVFVPGRGRWCADWEEGWVSNIRTGLWPVDVDNPALFESIIRDLGVEIPRTWRQETGREGGGYHLLYDGRDLPERYWAQGGLGDPCWGDLKANGWVAAAGALHPTGRRYTQNPDWPGQILPPPQWFAEFVIEQREKWRASLSKLGAIGSGRMNASSMGGENRNIRLISLRGTLFNKVPELDEDEIEQALWAANEEFVTPMTDHEMLTTVLKPKPNFVRHPAAAKPEPLTSQETPWLPRDPGTAVTGLDPDGRVPLDGDVKKDNSPYDVLRLAWAVALGHASPHVAVKGGDLVVVSGAEGGALDISELTPHRLRLLCASAGLTYYHHVKEKEDAAGNVVDVEEWDEPALPSIQLCNTVLTAGYQDVPAGPGRHQPGARAAPRPHLAGAPGGRSGHHEGLLAPLAYRAHPVQAQSV